MPGQKTNSRANDDRYASAVQPVVDEAMRIDNIAPIIQKAICENKPLNDELHAVVTEAVIKNPDTKEAIDQIISQNRSVKRDKLLVGVLSAVSGAVITIIAGVIVNIVSE